VLVKRFFFQHISLLPFVPALYFCNHISFSVTNLYSFYTNGLSLPVCTDLLHLSCVAIYLVFWFNLVHPTKSLVSYNFCVPFFFCKMKLKGRHGLGAFGGAVLFLLPPSRVNSCMLRVVAQIPLDVRLLLFEGQGILARRTSLANRCTRLIADKEHLQQRSGSHVACICSMIFRRVRKIAKSYC
jgi:hypothetical protein